MSIHITFLMYFPSITLEKREFIESDKCMSICKKKNYLAMSYTTKI